MKSPFHSLLTISLAAIWMAACSNPQIQSAHTQTPTPPQIWKDGLTITLADNGNTFEMKVGDNLLLKLGDDFDWSSSTTDESILGRVNNNKLINGTQGVFQAIKPGATILSLSGEPACRASNPPCMMPSILFQVTIIVK